MENKENNEELFRRLEKLFNNLFPNNGTPFDMNNMNTSNPNALLDNFFNENDGITYKTTVYTTEDGTQVTTISAGYSDFKPQTKNPMSKTTAQKISQLEIELQEQLKVEAYEAAAETRDLIKSLKNNKVKEEINTNPESDNDSWNFS